MLNSLRLRRFRAWQDTGPVRLAPLTVFFGEHGTGKSSLGHALKRLGQPDAPSPTLQVEATPAPATVTFVEAHPLATEGVRHVATPSLTQPWLQAMGLEGAALAGPTGLSARHAQGLLDTVFGAPPDSTVWLEHPENHLHPKAQAVLMDALIAAAQRGVQCIVESHSEAFLNRLQRRVAEAVVTPDHIALYVCRLRGPHAELEPLRLNAYGDIENWPEDLFGHDMTDITARALAALRRRQADTGEPQA